jgi:hypothetical protein
VHPINLAIEGQDGKPTVMISNLTVRILLPTDRDFVLNFSKERLRKATDNSMEGEMQSWTAPWRIEALDHYLPQGWCFGAFDGDQLQGYVLAQPFLFFRGRTQTVWIEHVEVADKASRPLLLETIYRWSRDKHMQCLIVEKSEDIANALESWPNIHEVTENYLEIRSARYV